MTRPAEKKETRGTAADEPYTPPPVRGVAITTPGQSEMHVANIKGTIDKVEADAKAQEERRENASKAEELRADAKAEEDGSDG